MKKIFILIAVIGLSASCKKEEGSTANLIFKIHFDPTLPRLDNFGEPAVIPSGHSAQSPDFKSMSAHYIELAPTHMTALGNGDIVYQGAETTSGGANAVDFNQAKIVSDNETFCTVPISDVTPGTYEWVRVSLTYQNYDIAYTYSGANYTGRLASFVGYNTYIKDHVVDGETVTVNGNKLQGYWAFETLGSVSSGQAPATTVPNPISSTSPIPPGSCVVTGSFPTPLTITGNEKSDVVVYLNLSTNQSFEWKDNNGNGLFEPTEGDTVTDMGLRGLYPTY